MLVQQLSNYADICGYFGKLSEHHFNESLLLLKGFEVGGQCPNFNKQINMFFMSRTQSLEKFSKYGDIHVGHIKLLSLSPCKIAKFQESHIRPTQCCPSYTLVLPKLNLTVNIIQFLKYMRESSQSQREQSYLFEKLSNQKWKILTTPEIGLKNRAIHSFHNCIDT